MYYNAEKDFCDYAQNVKCDAPSDYAPSSSDNEVLLYK